MPRLPTSERQAYVFEQMSRGYGAAHPDSIRRMMTQATASATDRRARFVGEEAYVAAGGRIERDLFADDAGDPLARHRHPRAARLREDGDARRRGRRPRAGLGWVRPTLDSWIGHAQTARACAASRSRRRRSPTRRSATVDALEAEIEEIALGCSRTRRLSEEARDAAEAKIRELGDRIDAIVNKPPVIDDELKPQRRRLPDARRAGPAAARHRPLCRARADGEAMDGEPSAATSPEDAAA